MDKRYNLWAFYLTLLCLGLVAVSFYSILYNKWLITPPNYIFLMISVLTFTLGVIGFKYNRNMIAKIRGWFTVVLSFLISIALFLVICLSLWVDDYMETVHSPDGHYTIDFYRYDLGAAGSFGVRGELNGPLWFKKHIYIQNNSEQVNVKWVNDSTISINNYILNLKEGETYGY